MTIVATHTLSLEYVLEAATLADLAKARRALQERHAAVVPFAPLHVTAGKRSPRSTGPGSRPVRVLRCTVSSPGEKNVDLRPGGGE